MNWIAEQYCIDALHRSIWHYDKSDDYRGFCLLLARDIVKCHGITKNIKEIINMIDYKSILLKNLFNKIKHAFK